MNNRINNSFNNPINNSIKNPLIKGTIVLTLAGLFCRILGFYYRIFLNAHIGAYGMGMLQLITPLCGIAFSVCICGFNSAISRYTAADRQSLKPLISGLFLSIPMSVIFSALCYIMSLRYMISIEKRRKKSMLSIKYGIKRTDSVQDLPESVLFQFFMY